MRRGAAALGLFACFSLWACATEGPEATKHPTPTAPAPGAPPPTAPPAQGPAASPSPAEPPRGPFARLEGWDREDHAAALSAFQSGCGATHELDLAVLCREARDAGALGESDARSFLETHFLPEPVGDAGLLTAYFTPIYDARAGRDAEFSAPVRPRPADLPAADASPGARAPYADRARIDARRARDALAWMRPEDLFFLQIQGSGVLILPGGGRRKAVFDGSNGAPFRGVAAAMRERGLLADDNTSGDAIHAWLAAHRGAAANAIMRLDPRYVFFRLVQDDGALPAGAAGVTLVAGRSVAVDPAYWSMGDPLWVDASSPALADAFPTYRRFAMALDAGGAIKGKVRADLYLGRGERAGEEAGRVRHVLRLYRLVPAPGPPP
jgi:membrane-bound lytic murein transglycosylase A